MQDIRTAGKRARSSSASFDTRLLIVRLTMVHVWIEGKARRCRSKCDSICGKFIGKQTLKMKGNNLGSRTERDDIGWSAGPNQIGGEQGALHPQSKKFRASRVAYLRHF